MKTLALAAMLTLGLSAQSGPPSAPTISAIVNSADNSTIIAANTWVTVYGTNLAFPGDVRPWHAADFTNNQMPTSLDGVSVSFSNGERAFVSFISPTQINILTPPDLVEASVTDGYGVMVEVDYVGVGEPIPGCITLATYSGSCYTSYAPCLSGETCDGDTDSFTCNGFGQCALPTRYSPVSPALFTLNGADVVAEHANGALISRDSPASPGEEIVLYGEGLGAVNPPVVSGSPTQLGALLASPIAEIGGVSAEVKFAGLISPGLYQMNVVVPQNASSGGNVVVVVVQQASSQPGVLLPIE